MNKEDILAIILVSITLVLIIGSLLIKNSDNINLHDDKDAV